MDTIENIRTFLTVARLGSFSLAARQMRTVPSVLSKRVSQLEHRLKTPLFRRSTRGLEITGAGHRYQQRFAKLLSELDAAFEDLPEGSKLQDHLRIKCPTTLSVLYISDILIDFRLRHPGMTIDLVLVDRSVNPIEEGYDIAIGGLPSSYPHVADIHLCAQPRTMVASPAYLDRRGRPRHPRDLGTHDCVNFSAVGTSWTFIGPAGEETAVDVNCIFNTNDSQVLLKAALQGVGVAILSEHIARETLATGALEQVLLDFRVPDIQVKALIPERRLKTPAVTAVVDALIAGMQPLAPWDR